MGGSQCLRELKRYVISEDHEGKRKISQDDLILNNLIYESVGKDDTHDGSQIEIDHSPLTTGNGKVLKT